MFVTDASGKVMAKAENASQPSAFAKWLEEQADAYARSHPSTRVPLIRAQVVAEGEGDERKATCAELDSALSDGQAVLLYVGRSASDDDDKQARLTASASRKFEKATLGSKSAAEAAEDVVLLRLDVGNSAHALLAKTLGVTKIPTLLLWAPRAGKPVDLGGRISGGALAAKLKKLPAPSAETSDQKGDEMGDE